MFRTVTALATILVAACGGYDGIDSAAAPPALIPAPSYIEVNPGAYALRPGTTVAIPPDTELRDGIAWIAGLIEDASGVSLQTSSSRAAGIRLALVDADELRKTFAARGIRATEGAYFLKADTDGVQIRAATEAGLFYGFTTLWQLIALDAGGGVAVPALEILDAPEFGWRGVMLDSARHMQSPAFIKRYIDWMSLHKLNVFHWHLTDDQAWRLEVRRYPRLTEVGAWRVPAGDAPANDIDAATGAPRLYGGFYSQEDVREIVAHAESRFVDVVPEINVPGHASAAIAAYPELGIPGHKIDRVPARWGIYDNVLNLEESTFEFLENVLVEVTDLFPGQYIHVGGDEVVTRQWEGSDRIARRMRELDIADVSAVQNYYVERLQAHLAELGRTVIGWDEILESDLPPQTAVMSWRGVEGAISAATKGHRTVLSPAPIFYLDHLQTDAADAPPGRGHVVTVRDVYEFDFLTDSLGDDREFVLGLQANLWTEHVRTEERAEYMTYPRVAAVAELAWSEERNRTWESFSVRLEPHLERLRSLGINVADPFPGPDQSRKDGRVEDRELDICSESVVLALEDDAPLAGERESFLVDIINPCWILRDADLGSARSISASVGQLPFNFEIGDLLDDVVVEPPESTEGELLVRLGNCEGPVVATLALKPAAERYATTELPAAPLVVPDGTAGKGDLCFSFTRGGVEPIWAIDWIQLHTETAGNRR